MLLENKNAVVFAATGAIGRELAMSFAREGAVVHVSGRNKALADEVAAEITAAGGMASSYEVDAMDEVDIEAHLDAVMRNSDSIDIAVNAIGIRAAEGGYGTPAIELPFEKFMLPITRHAGSQFLTSRAVARRMVPKKRGVILTLSASIAVEARPLMSGVSAACAAVESLTRSLAADLGPFGIRVVGLRPGPLPDTRTIQETNAANAKTVGMPVEAFAGLIAQASLMHRTATLAEVGAVAALLASDHAAAMTGDVTNISCGLVVR